MSTKTAKADLLLPGEDAQSGIRELDDALEMSDNALIESAPLSAAADQRVRRAITESDVEQWRRRAQKQRETGIANLERRHEGIASVVKDVTINERVVGSAFERYFSVIENGIYVVGKRGPAFFGPAAFTQIHTTIVDMIVGMEKRVKADLEGLHIQFSLLSSNEGFVTPSYTKPASERKVQLRTRNSDRVLKVYEVQDQVIGQLQTLLWNGEVEQSAIDSAELQIKKDMKALAHFLNRTLRGMRNKLDAAKPAPVAANSAAVSAEASAATAAVAAEPVAVAEAA